MLHIFPLKIYKNKTLTKLLLRRYFKEWINKFNKKPSWSITNIIKLNQSKQITSMKRQSLWQPENYVRWNIPKSFIIIFIKISCNITLQHNEIQSLNEIKTKNETLWDYRIIWVSHFSRSHQYSDAPLFGWGTLWACMSFSIEK